MGVKVSIIVPVYNAEKYLANCLSTILFQTLKDIEIIIVNDCSTDNSMKIMNDCATQFSDKVKVINSGVNRGPGGARNQGLEIATGEYIGFVDCDDMIGTTMYEKLYCASGNGTLDVVDCGFYYEKLDEAHLYTSDEITGILDAHKRSELIVSGGYIWSKIFRKQYLDQHKLRFRENAILEDSDFLTYVYATAQTIGNVKEILYKYTYSESSASGTTDSLTYYINIKNAMKAIYDKVSELSNYKEIQEAVEYEIMQMYSYGINMCFVSQDNDVFNASTALKEMLSLRDAIVKMNYKNKYIKNKIAEIDVNIMKMNDYSPTELLKQKKK